MSRFINTTYLYHGNCSTYIYLDKVMDDHGKEGGRKEVTGK